MVFVTHDVEEAIYLSDEIHVMGTRPGRILETIPVHASAPARPHQLAHAGIHRRSRSAASNLLTPTTCARGGGLTK